MFLRMLIFMFLAGVMLWALVEMAPNPPLQVPMFMPILCMLLGFIFGLSFGAAIFGPEAYRKRYPDRWLLPRPIKELTSGEVPSSSYLRSDSLSDLMTPLECEILKFHRKYDELGNFVLPRKKFRG